MVLYLVVIFALHDSLLDLAMRVLCSFFHDDDGMRFWRKRAYLVMRGTSLLAR
jgi:hypothetical protein